MANSEQIAEGPVSVLYAGSEQINSLLYEMPERGYVKAEVHTSWLRPFDQHSISWASDLPFDEAHAAWISATEGLNKYREEQIAHSVIGFSDIYTNVGRDKGQDVVERYNRVRANTPVINEIHTPLFWSLYYKNGSIVRWLNTNDDEKPQDPRSDITFECKGQINKELVNMLIRRTAIPEVAARLAITDELVISANRRFKSKWLFAK